MSFIGRMFGKAVRLPPERQRRLDDWRAIDEPDPGGAHSLLRFTVVDVESSGLDVHGDSLITIGAIAIDASRIVYDESFHAVLRQDRASSVDNILLHGIGGSAQTGGEDPAEVLLRFLEFIGKSPLIGFHTPFDETMIRKATRKYLGEEFKRLWLDLAWLAPALEPEHAEKLKNLDDWMGAFHIVNLRRHDALGDALATGQVFQILQHRAAAKGMRSASDLIEAARSREWLAKRRR
jgi:DNA polymerase-3 subunit epsilon